MPALKIARKKLCVNDHTLSLTASGWKFHPRLFAGGSYGSKCADASSCCLWLSLYHVVGLLCKLSGIPLKGDLMCGSHESP